jgi:hypothetical protein
MKTISRRDLLVTDAPDFRAAICACANVSKTSLWRLDLAGG